MKESILNVLFYLLVWSLLEISADVILLILRQFSSIVEQAIFLI